MATKTKFDVSVLGVEAPASPRMAKRFVEQEALKNNILALKRHWEETTQGQENINFPLYLEFIFQDILRVVDNQGE